MIHILFVGIEEPEVHRIAKGLARMFPRAQISNVQTAIDALECVKTDHSINVIVSETEMPGMSGLAFLDRIAAIQTVVRFIFLTAHSTEQKAIEAVNRGADAFIRRDPQLEKQDNELHSALEKARIHQSEMRQLQERVRTLNAFYSILRILDDMDSPHEEQFGDIVDMVSDVLFGTTRASVRLRMDDIDVNSRGYDDSGPSVLIDIRLKDELLGTLEAYSNSGREIDENAEDFLAAIADSVAMRLEHCRTNQALRLSEEKHRALLDNLLDGIAVEDEKGYFTYANPQAVKMLGYELDEVVGKHWTGFVNGDELQHVRGESQRRPRGEHSTYETVLQKKDGTTLAAVISAKALMGEDNKFLGTLSVFTDISQLKSTQEALIESEQAYKALFEQSLTSLMIEDLSEVKRYVDQLKADGVKDFRSHFDDNPEEVIKCAAMVKVVDVNDTTVKTFRAKNKEDLLTNLERVVRKDALPGFKEALISIINGETCLKRETFNYTLDGQKLHILLRCTIPPCSTETWGRAIVSIVVISSE